MSSSPLRQSVGQIIEEFGLIYTSEVGGFHLHVLYEIRG